MTYLKNKYILKSNVFLIGFMGAGKTDVAKKMSQICGIDFFDTDDFIVKTSRKSISELITEKSQNEFRKLENIAIEQSIKQKQIVATGGGCVENSNSVDILKQGYCVMLDVNYKTAYSRVLESSSRPLLSNFESGEELFNKRAKLYEQLADYKINTKNKSVDVVAKEIIDHLLKEEVMLR